MKEFYKPRRGRRLDRSHFRLITNGKSYGIEQRVEWRFLWWRGVRWYKLRDVCWAEEGPDPAPIQFKTAAEAESQIAEWIEEVSKEAAVVNGEIWHGWQPVRNGPEAPRKQHPTRI